MLNSVVRGKVDYENLKQALVNQVPRIGSRFDDSLELLVLLGLIEKRPDGILATLNIKSVSSEILIDRILRNKTLAYQFFMHCNSLQWYDSASNADIVLSKTQISREFLWFVFLLEQLGVLEKSHYSNYHVLREWTDRFLNFVELGISNSFRSNPPSRYREAIEHNVRVGTAAEEFVLTYERQRLARHKLVDWIKHVAIEDVGAGFDILSFDYIDDYLPNRLIEVKSWVGRKKFYLTRNEYDVAQSNEHQYYIYLVDRDSMYNKGYVPEILEFQSAMFFNDAGNWKVESDGWRIDAVSKNR